MRPGFLAIAGVVLAAVLSVWVLYSSSGDTGENGTSARVTPDPLPGSPDNGEGDQEGTGSVGGPSGDRDADFVDPGSNVLKSGSSTSDVIEELFAAARARDGARCEALANEIHRRGPKAQDELYAAWKSSAEGMQMTAAAHKLLGAATAYVLRDRPDEEILELLLGPIRERLKGLDLSGEDGRNLTAFLSEDSKWPIAWQVADSMSKTLGFALQSWIGSKKSSLPPCVHGALKLASQTPWVSEVADPWVSLIFSHLKLDGSNRDNDASLAIALDSPNFGARLKAQLRAASRRVPGDVLDLLADSVGKDNFGLTELLGSYWSKHGFHSREAIEITAGLVQAAGLRNTISAIPTALFFTSASSENLAFAFEGVFHAWLESENGSDACVALHATLMGMAGSIMRKSRSEFDAGLYGPLVSFVSPDQIRRMEERLETGQDPSVLGRDLRFNGALRGSMLLCCVAKVDVHWAVDQLKRHASPSGTWCFGGCAKALALLRNTYSAGDLISARNEVAELIAVFSRESMEQHASRLKSTPQQQVVELFEFLSEAPICAKQIGTSKAQLESLGSHLQEYTVFLKSERDAQSPLAKSLSAKRLEVMKDRLKHIGIDW